MNPYSIHPDDATIHLMCARFWPERHGGVEQRMLHVARGLVEAGQSVTVLTENRAGAPAFETMEPGLAVRRFAPLDCGRLWRWRDILRRRWWQKVINDTGPGPLWATDPIMAAAAIHTGRRASLVFNPACCVAAFDALARHYPAGGTLRMSQTLHRYDRIAWTRAPRVVLSSENLREQFTDAYGLRGDVTIVPHGVNPTVRIGRAPARAQFGLSEQAYVIGFVGRLDPCKDLGFLFDAITRVPEDVKPHLLIVGDGPDRERLEHLAQAYGIPKQITWTGATEDPTDAYAAMDVMVLPSWYEAFGNVILEAMAQGVPVIARRRDATHHSPVLTASEELIAPGRTGAVIDAHDISALAGELTRLYRLPNERRAMAVEARRAAARRPWSQTVAAYMDVLDTGAARIPLRRAA